MRLRLGRRYEDPPEKGISGWRFRFMLALRRWPIQAALLAAVIAAAMPLTLLIRKGGENTSLIREIQVQRLRTTPTLCAMRDVMVDVLVRNPEAEGRQAAIVKLKALDCGREIKAIKGTTP